MTGQFDNLAPGQAVAVDWDFGRYLGDRECISRSGLLLARDDPEAYALGLKSDDTEALKLGRLVHLAVLEPQEWASRIAPPRKPDPAWVGTKSAWKKLRASLIQANADARPIDITDQLRDKVEAIAARVRRHKFAAGLIGLDGPTEQTIIWREPRTGVLVRVRPDKLGKVRGGGIAVPDLKTTRDPRPDEFSRSMLKLNYHFQAAMYVDAVQALHPGAPVTFAIIAVRTSPPYKVGAWPVAERAIQKGRDEYLEALHEFARRRAEDDWVEDWERDFTTEIDLPEYAYR